MTTSITIEPEVENATYDYIVCGGGTSGSVLAARLAEDPNTSVLVIEAGQHNELLENTIMVGGWSQNFDTAADWNIVTEPNPGVNGRQVKVSRGKFLGGSSGVNGTLCIRGTPQDYDDWNMPGWSGKEVFGYMKKAENFHSKKWFKADENAHGHEGLLDTEPHDLAPISNMILESMQDKGLGLQDDMFTTGDNPHGCGHAPRTVYKGDRTTAANYFVNKGPNLSIKTDTTVDRIILEGEGANLRASAVKIVEKNGSTREIKAKKEIIISGGAYCSPTVLMRSGIGSKHELAQHNIDCKVDLPGVGKNLMDHLIVFIFYETKQPNITNDHLLYKPDALGEAYRQWKEEKRGPLSTFPFGAFGYARLDERLKSEPLWQSAPRKEGRDPMGLTSAQPNIEFFSTECYGGPKQYDKFPNGEDTHAFSLIAELFAPKSRGNVSLKSTDPMENPVVDHKYLSEDLDILVLSEACKFANEIITQGKATKSIVHGSWPADLTHHKHTRREDWEPYVRDNATTCYHPGGTCKMGTNDDPMAVLDAELRVRGVKGLRVADTSVMPLLNQGHTQMPAYAIGEKAADLIKGSFLTLNEDIPAGAKMTMGSGSQSVNGNGILVLT
ncbi:probable glucose dehydrogenase precursor short protein] [Rhynchosporium secalis]|uniref:Probable glucose dehydrogenase short protein] n=1 Tax=Rhynchosporium secalis TaxID=38038 RepID=A0A1E1MV55_RHYSE|nr:probable glucose dehydrogenase precursor short protein] [Rhynchosporium secalis]